MTRSASVSARSIRIRSLRAGALRGRPSDLARSAQERSAVVHTFRNLYSYAMSDVVHLERDGSVGVIRIDRPKVNALNAEIVAGIDDACATVESDEAIRAVVITGGDRTFSAGADLKEMAEGT